MLNWNFDPSQYTEKNFKPLDEGDYLVRISKAGYKEAKNGNTGLEITLDVSGKNNKLNFYIWFDPDNAQLTNQRICGFFLAFGIDFKDQDDLDSWKGKIGAVHVRPAEYKGRTITKVVYCLDRDSHKRLPEWQESLASNKNKYGMADDIKLPSQMTSYDKSSACRSFGSLTY